MIKKYIKTTPVEAMQVTLDNYEEIRVFVYPQRTTCGYDLYLNEDKMHFRDGDYIIKDATGECYVCRKNIFEKTYKEVKE
ncbi:hypothetical protein Si064_00893 [Streptococcus infantarius subsp. infantarius]|uniref:hypothetical protein n=1 Tax=Streptococcus sp. TaxID=1306 RepID=UPI000EDD4DCF|nr:hypothetical protein [Streptococcus sp.]MCO4566556.1 hypothetical protein [Streptococcus infantarius subsp. infantarius]MCO4612244.1 hypothetical protein [Streptococcus infantarius subsp. infantarius]HCT82922.1 hypothetical protein [Streptococcus sp.]